MPTAVQFGAGNIGRGFIAQLFHESGFEVVFVDVQPALVEKLNRDRAYIIHIVGPNSREIRIDNVRAVDGRNLDAVASELAQCEVACTAVGAAVLPHIAPALSAGLSKRHEADAAPLNILICENLHDAADRLRELISAQLDSETRDEVLANTGFVQAVVSRMVPLQEPGDSMDIRVEAYKHLPVDGRAIVRELPEIAGVEPVNNFHALVERKLYTHNCLHATLGYLGYQRGIEFGWQAMEDKDIRHMVNAVANETGAALIEKHGFDVDEHFRHVQDLRERFANRELGDTCFRLARDPIRKLAPDDRLVGAARLCESQGVEPRILAMVIASALSFDSPDDPSSVELQRRIQEQGLTSVLSEVCGIDPDEWLGQAILAELKQ